MNQALVNVIEETIILETGEVSVEIVEVSVEIVELLEVGIQGLPGVDGVNMPVAWTNVYDKPTVFTPANHTHVEADIPELEPQIDLTLLFENAIV